MGTAREAEQDSLKRYQWGNQMKVSRIKLLVREYRFCYTTFKSIYSLEFYQRCRLIKPKDLAVSVGDHPCLTSYEIYAFSITN